MSHVAITNNPDRILGTRIGTCMSDLILGFDMIVAAGKDAINTVSPTKTKAVINDHLVPLAAFAERPDLPLEAGDYLNVIMAALGDDQVDFFDATTQVSKLLGDTISSNTFQLGYAFQKGYIPLKAGSIEEAIRLNNVAVELNLRAFSWGRVAAADPEKLNALIGLSSANSSTVFSLDAFIQDRCIDLKKYQNQKYADCYLVFMNKIRIAVKLSLIHI